MNRVYIDATNIITLIISGDYDKIRNAAKQAGYELTISDTIYTEIEARLSDSQFSNSEKSKISDWLGESANKINRVPDLPGKDYSNPDGGEQSLYDLIEDDIRKGVKDNQFWTDDKGALKKYAGSSVDGVDVKIRAIFDTNNYPPVKSFLKELHEGGYISARDTALVRDSILESGRITSENSAQTDIGNRTPPAKFRYVMTDSDLKVSKTVLKDGSGGLDYDPVNQVRDNRISVDEAYERSPKIKDAARKLSDLAKNKRGTVLIDPVYNVDGTITPEGRAALNRLNKAAIGAGVALAIYDAYDTAKRARAYAEAGDYENASYEIAGLAGRLYGGLWGAEFGFAAGGIAGAIIGGIAGAIVGDEAIRTGANWLFDLFNPLFRRCEPLVFDLNADSVRLTSITGSSVFFDLDSDGFAERTGWVSSEDGLLALDINGNGKIDNGSELFGTPTIDGYTILRELDSNADGFISSADNRFSDLLMWRDVNQNGISEASELASLDQWGIVTIDLNATKSSVSRAGNDIWFEGVFGKSNGISGRSTCRCLYN